MAVTVAQLLTSIYRRIGTQDTDPEYPAEQLLTYLNDAIGECWQDCARLAPDVLLTVGRTLTKTAEPNVYAFAQQSPAIGVVEQVRRVQSGSEVLTCVAYEQRHVASEYSLTGPSTAQMLITDARGAITVDVIEGAPAVAASADPMPAFIPAQFRSVLEYMVVREAMAQGDEARMPVEYMARFDERRDMLWEHWRNRSADPHRRRDRA